MRLMVLNMPPQSVAPVKSNYDLWKENGHPDGTPEEFLEYLRGKDGDENVYLQEEVPTPKKLPSIWIQVGVAGNPDAITLNIIKKKKVFNP